MENNFKETRALRIMYDVTLCSKKNYMDSWQV